VVVNTNRGPAIAADSVLTAGRQHPPLWWRLIGVEFGIPTEQAVRLRHYLPLADLYAMIRLVAGQDPTEPMHQFVHRPANWAR
jgi:hypothetical protein